MGTERSKAKISKRKTFDRENSQQTTETTATKDDKVKPTNSFEINIERASERFNAEGTIIIKLVC